MILGNDALMKCGVPGFAADLTEVTGWSVGDAFDPNKDGEDASEFHGAKKASWS